jgi:3-oxoacyl-[acyl-carrier-protein] synthase-3
MITLTNFSHYVPDKVYNNNDVARDYGISSVHAQNLERSTRIKERRYSEEFETVEYMVENVVCKILQESGLEPVDIDGLIVGTLTPTYFTPSTSVVVANSVGIPHCFAFDLSAACSGWIYGFDTATAFLKTGKAKRMVVVGAEKLSATLSPNDYKTAFLFGDAAAGCLVSIGNDLPGVIHSQIGVRYDKNKNVYIKTPFADTAWQQPQWHLLGKEVYAQGVELVVSEIKKYFDTSRLSWDDFDGFIPHQANGKMIAEIREKLDVPEKYLFSNIALRGNTGAASIPLCISEMKPPPGRYLMFSIGAGYTFGLVDTYL